MTSQSGDERAVVTPLIFGPATANYLRLLCAFLGNQSRETSRSA
jgi:hypothetical protein